MQALVCRNGELDVQEIPALRPGPGQILLDGPRLATAPRTATEELGPNSAQPRGRAGDLAPVPRDVDASNHRGGRARCRLVLIGFRECNPLQPVR